MRTGSLIAGAAAVCLSLAMAACSKEGKARSAMVAGCMSQGASRDVCMCSFGKLKGKYGVAALIAMDEDGVIPSGFPETAVAVARQCSSGAIKEASSRLVDVGGGAGFASNAGPGANNSDTDQREIGVASQEAYCIETAKKLQAAGEQVRCDGTSIVKMDQVKQAADIEQAAPRLSDSEVKQMYFDELINGKPCCGWAQQEDMLLDLIGEGVDGGKPAQISWTTSEVLQLSSEGVRTVYPDNDQGPDPKAVAFRTKFCGLHQQQLQEDNDMQLCLLGVFGE